MALLGSFGSSLGVLLYHFGAFSGDDFGDRFPANIFLRALGSLSSDVAGIPFSGLDVLETLSGRAGADEGFREFGDMMRSFLSAFWGDEMLF